MEKTILALLPSYHSSSHEGPVGGGEISNKMLLEELSRRGWDVVVITRRSDCNGVHRGVLIHNIDGKSAKTKRFLGSLFSLLKYRNVSIKLSKKIKPDLILCSTSAFSFSRDVSRACGNKKVGLLVRAFENFEPDVSFLVFNLRRIFTSMVGDSLVHVDNKPDFFIFNSEYMANRIIKNCYVLPHCVVYPPVDVEPSSDRPAAKALNVHMVGMTRNKGFHIFYMLAKKFPQLNFKVFGKSDGSWNVANFPGNLKFCGWATRENIYGGADIFLVPSLWEEPFGRVAVEALANNCIVIVSKAGGLPEAVAYSEDIVVDGNSFSSWADKLNDVLDNMSFYGSLCSSVAKGVDRFSLSNQADFMESFLLIQLDD